MSDDTRLQILEAIASGALAPQDAMKQLDQRMVGELGFACIDHDRTRRCGMPEVIFAEHKTPTQTIEIAREVLQQSPMVLLTRATEAISEAVCAAWPEAIHDTRKQTILIGTPPAPYGALVGVVAAGTSDLPIAEEAQLSLSAMGCAHTLICDVGVAGLHRLLRHKETLTHAGALIVVAGMEGALPSVVGGLVSTPVIAVPTSVGYGASFGGVAALLGMLNSCASGVGVVNIDNGFGAAALAARIVHAQHIRSGDN